MEPNPSVKLDWILNENKRYKINLGVTKELYGFVLGDIIELMFIFLGVLVVLWLCRRMPLFLGNACRSIPEVYHFLLNDSLRIKVLAHLDGERRERKEENLATYWHLLNWGNGHYSNFNRLTLQNVCGGNLSCPLEWYD